MTIQTYLQSLSDIIAGSEPVARRLCPACRGTMESHSAYRDGTCMKCDDGYAPEPRTAENDPELAAWLAEPDPEDE